MHRRSLQSLALAAAVLTALFLPACFGGGGGPSVARGEPTGVDSATVYVNNLSNETIYYVYMSPSSQNTWGPDLLGSEVLPIGGSHMLYNIGAGYWDVKVVDSSGNTKELYNVYVEAGGIYDWNIDAYDWY